MKKILYSVSIICAIWACNLKPASIRYNDEFVEIQNQVEHSVDSVSKCISSARIKDINQSLQFCKTTLSQIKLKIKDSDSFENDATLNIALEHYCTTYDSLLTVYTPKIVLKYQIPNERYTYEEHRKLEWIIKQFNSERKKNIERLKKTQEQFAQRHQYKL